LNNLLKFINTRGIKPSSKFFKDALFLHSIISEEEKGKKVIDQ